MSFRTVGAAKHSRVLRAAIFVAGVALVAVLVARMGDGSAGRLLAAGTFLALLIYTGVWRWLESSEPCANCGRPFYRRAFIIAEWRSTCMHCGAHRADSEFGGRPAQQALEAAGARRIVNDTFFFSAPQLKRGPLGGAARAFRAGAEPLPQPSWGDDLNWRIGDVQEAPVARHEHVGTPSLCLTQHPRVGGVQGCMSRARACRDDGCLTLQEPLEFANRVLGYADLAREHLLQLRQHGLAKHEVVLGEDDHQEVSAEAPRRDRADDDIRVEEDLQETSRKTSLSVR